MFIYAMFTFEKKNVTALKHKISGIFSEQTTSSELNSYETTTNVKRIDVSVEKDDLTEDTKLLNNSNDLNHQKR